MKTEVFIRRPILRTILNSHGKEILKKYVINSWKLSETKPDLVFLNVLKDQLLKIYDQETAGQAYKQMLEKPLVSTIDHLGVWNHPIFVNSALIYSLHFSPNELAITLATESVSLNNTSSWSGSLLKHDTSISLRRYSFFPDKLKTLPVFSAPVITQHNTDKINKVSNGILKNLLQKIEVNEASNFSAQTSKMSTLFWKLVFPSAPKLIYAPLETVVIAYLLEVFKNSSHILSKLILNGEGRELWGKYFSNDHTFLFWEINKYGKRIPIRKLSKTSEEIQELLKARKIYPSSTLCFAVLLQAGIACVGGFTQTTWLTKTKANVIKLFTELAATKDILEIVSKVPTANFAECALVWLKIEGVFVNPSGVDLFLLRKDLYSKYSELASFLTLEQAINLAIPTIYNIVVPKLEQNIDWDAINLQNQLIQDYKIEDIIKN